MNLPDAFERDSFIVCYERVISTVWLQRNSAGWEVHVLTDLDKDGYTVFFGRSLGTYESLGAACRAGEEAAINRSRSTASASALRIGHSIKAKAVQIASIGRQFAPVLEVVDGNQVVTDSQILSPPNGARLSLIQAKEAARRALGAVRGVSELGRLII